MTSLPGRITVLDLSRNLAGPFAAMVLGDLGANVIKIEPPGHGDDSRTSLPLWNGEGSLFLLFNRNKRSVAVDMKAPAGREVILRLAKQADVFIQSLRPGAVEELGLGYDDLKQVRPELIYCSISGFGRSGPDALRAGYDPIAQAYTGLMEVIGEEDRPPSRAQIGATDIPTGMWAVIAIQGALFRRQQTGLGDHLDVSLLGTGLTYMSTYLAAYMLSGELPKRQGTKAAAAAPYEALPTADSYLMIACGNDRLWPRLCKAIERPQLTDDPRFKTNALRVQNRNLMHELLSSIFKEKPSEHWEEALTEAGVPCSVVNTLAQMVEKPHIKEGKWIVPIAHSQAKNLRVVASPLRSSGYEVPYGTPPLLGQHTDEILGEIGYTGEELVTLRADGIIA